MTLEEFCKEFGYKKSSVESNFQRVREAIYKKSGGAVDVWREGVEYLVERRASNMYEIEGEKCFWSSVESLGFPIMEFQVLLGLSTLPRFTYRGTYGGFLNYLGLKKGKAAKEQIKNACMELDKKAMIFFHEDVTDSNFIFVSFCHAFEKELVITNRLLRACYGIGKKDALGILKVWLYLRIKEERNEVHTLEEVSRATGLSKYKVRQYIGVLEEEKIYVNDPVWLTVEGSCVRLGTLSKESAF